MGNKVITLQSIGQKEIKEDSERFIDMSDFYVEDYREIMRYLRPIKINNLDVTVLDLFNIPLTTDDAIKDFILKRTSIDIDSKEGLQKINDLFNKAIDLYEKRYFKKIPKKIQKLYFKDSKQVINFLKETKTNKTSGIISCSIAKISYAINDILLHDKIKRESFLDRQFIKEHLEGPFQISEAYEDINQNIYRNGKVVIGDRIINFKLIARQKSKDSIIGKQISDAKYYSVDEFKDIVGVTIYVDKDDEAALMMQYIDQMIYRGKAEIKNKNGLSLKKVKNTTYLEQEFYLKLEAETKKIENKEDEGEKEFKERSSTFAPEKQNDKKSSSAKNYKEIKLVGNVYLSLEEGTKSSKFPIGTEIKFVVGGHDNEKGIALQTIYDYIKKFRELTRLGIPIREIDLINYVNDFFENIDFYLKKKNKEKHNYYNELLHDFTEFGYLDKEITLNGNIENNEKILALGLLNHFRANLVKIKMPNSTKFFYFDKHILSLRDAGLFKEIKKI
ncbi:hypothetical protein H3C61_00020 [Candidatus Gracilibacteria bacterium]|nr:hypothetical protein [Candidatus Gracilibacteria bacterium]